MKDERCAYRFVAGLVLVLLAVIFAAALLGKAHAQVTQQAPPKVAKRVAEVSHLDPLRGRHCAVWYYQASKYAPWSVGFTAVDLTLLTPAQVGELAAAWKADDWQRMAAQRTHDITVDSPLLPAFEPCSAAWPAKPAGPFVVEPSTPAAVDAPVYAVVAGARSTRVVARARRGERCGCHFLVFETSASAFCPLWPASTPVDTNQVVRCAAAKQ